MGDLCIQELLPLVEKPSAYLGNEKNRIVKEETQDQLRFALAFPDLYEIGSCHFGMQILYHILNGHSEIAAERVFAPGLDMAGQMRASGCLLPALESGRPLAGFDIVGFSLLYELNYTNVLAMLDLAGIPFRSSDRDHRHPLVIAGGPCTVNPEPIADFFDAIVVGDGESVVLEMAEIWLSLKKQGAEKDKILHDWSKIPGVYIPGFYEPYWDESGFQRLRKINPEAPDTVERAIIGDLDAARFPERPVIPFGRPVQDRLRLEVARGCTRGCRFCQAGMIYRPVRERSPETLFRLAEEALKTTGYEDLSLLSLSTGDYSCLDEMLSQMMQCFGPRQIAVSFPSLRAGAISPTIMDLVKKVRKTGFTIAPEAGSQRLRDVINKNINEEDIAHTVSNAFRLGWRVIKLYFMIGLPTETQADIEAIASLVEGLKRQISGKGKKATLNVSVATFVPKPHTPFQLASQERLEDAAEKIEWLKRRLSGNGVHVKWQNPKVSRIEGLWARGDRKMSGFLEAAYRNGCIFDGWSDHFDYTAWLSAAEESEIDMHFYSDRTRRLDEPLPWDVIDCGVTKRYLKDEWEKALKSELTPDCRNGDCTGCGTCDFEKIRPVTFTGTKPQWEKRNAKAKTAKEENLVYQVTFEKLGKARYFGHLEMVNIISRAVRRAGIPVKYTEGFHPKPKMSFRDPLPIGIESRGEVFYLHLNDKPESKNPVNDMNRELPSGLAVVGFQPAPPRKKRKPPVEHTFTVSIQHGVFKEKQVQSFIDAAKWVMRKRRPKGGVSKIDLKEAVLALRLAEEKTFRLTVKAGAGKTVRPQDLMKHLFQMEEADIRKARIVKEADGYIEAIKKDRESICTES